MRVLQFTPVWVVAIVIASCGGSHHKTAAAEPTTFLAPVPGKVDRHIVQSNIHRTVCVHHYTKTVRPPVWYTQKLKRQQLDYYHLPGDMSDYEEDHLIPLSLGGSPDSPKNLWPEPHPRSFEVDKIEFQLYKSVCDDAMNLYTARHIISRIKHTEG